MDGFKNRIKNLFEEQEQLREHFKKLNIIINNYNDSNKFSNTNQILDTINKLYAVVVRIMLLFFILYIYKLFNISMLHENEKIISIILEIKI